MRAIVSVGAVGRNRELVCRVMGRIWGSHQLSADIGATPRDITAEYDKMLFDGIDNYLLAFGSRQEPDRGFST